jgi:hypothetical protein
MNAAVKKEIISKHVALGSTNWTDASNTHGANDTIVVTDIVIGCTAGSSVVQIAEYDGSTRTNFIVLNTASDRNESVSFQQPIHLTEGQRIQVITSAITTYVTINYYVI